MRGSLEVKVRFIPKLFSRYFGMDEIEVLHVPDESTYQKIIDMLEERFREEETMHSLFDSFIIMANGESVLKKLNEVINPSEEIIVVSLAFGG